MGRPSDQRRSAQRPGKNERARVKKKWSSRKSSGWIIHGAGGGTFSFKNLGPKKRRRWDKWYDKRHGNPFIANPSIGEPLIAENSS